jgi:hypothetical protein
LGGGIWAESATLTATSISGNYASQGGGIWANAVANLTSCTVNGNLAGLVGGGINATTASLLNTTVSDNHTTYGGGIRAFSFVLLDHVTVTDNSARTGGGLYHDPAGPDLFRVRNSIIAQNFVVPGGSAPDVSGDFISEGFNLIGDPTGSNDFTDRVNGDIVGTAENPRDPRLGPLANDGGRTLTHALLAGSPAIDAGNNADPLRTDQRGVGRPRDGDGNRTRIVDIGAFER